MTLSKKDEARVDAAVREMKRAEPRKAFTLRETSHFVRGWRVPWVVFRETEEFPRPFVEEVSEGMLRIHVGDVLKAGRRPKLRAVPAETLEAVERLESQLTELLRRYHSGEVAYALFSGNRIELCVNGVGYGVDARRDATGGWVIHQLIEHRGRGVTMSLARDLHRGHPEKQLRPIPEGVVEAVRARLAADGDVQQVMALLEAGRMMIVGMGATSDTGWRITFRDGQFIQRFSADRSERERTREQVVEIVTERRYLTLERME